MPPLLLVRKWCLRTTADRQSRSTASARCDGPAPSEKSTTFKQVPLGHEALQRARAPQSSAAIVSSSPRGESARPMRCSHVLTHTPFSVFVAENDLEHFTNDCFFRHKRYRNENGLCVAFEFCSSCGEIYNASGCRKSSPEKEFSLPPRAKTTPNREKKS